MLIQIISFQVALKFVQKSSVREFKKVGKLSSKLCSFIDKFKQPFDGNLLKCQSHMSLNQRFRLIKVVESTRLNVEPAITHPLSPPLL